jgi:hypothetical protein
VRERVVPHTAGVVHVPLDAEGEEDGAGALQGRPVRRQHRLQREVLGPALLRRALLRRLAAAARGGGTRERRAGRSRDHNTCVLQYRSSANLLGGCASTFEPWEKMCAWCMSTAAAARSHAREEEYGEENTCNVRQWNDGKDTHVVGLALFLDGVVVGVKIEEDGREPWQSAVAKNRTPCLRQDCRVHLALI